MATTPAHARLPSLTYDVVRVDRVGVESRYFMGRKVYYVQVGPVIQLLRSLFSTRGALFHLLINYSLLLLLTLVLYELLLRSCNSFLGDLCRV